MILITQWDVRRYTQEIAQYFRIWPLAIAPFRASSHELAWPGWGPFLESPVNFSGPKSHFKNCDPLILKSGPFNMISRYERANLLQNFIPVKVEMFRQFQETGPWGPFLESPANSSGPKSHFKNYDPLILKSWSFTMISRNERANLLQNLIPGNVFVFKIRRKYSTRNVPVSFGSFEKRAPGPVSEI